MAILNNPFAGTKDAKGYDNGVYLDQNFLGALEVRRCVFKKTRDQKELYIVECVVLESNMPDKHPVGSARTWSQNKNTDGAGKSLQDFCCAMEGIDRKGDPEGAAIVVSGVDELLCDSLCSVEHANFGGKSAYNGRKVRVETYGKETKKGKEKAAAKLLAGEKNVVVDKFTVHEFTPYARAAAKAA